MSERDSICASEEKPEGLRRCNLCGEEKSLSAFVGDRGNPAGRGYRCKPCHANLQKSRRRANPEAMRAIERKYARKVRTGRRWRSYATEQCRATRKLWRAKYPERTRAHRMVHEAVKKGELTRLLNCERCGTSGRIEASHTDYSKPLDVEWLCPRCHRRKDLGITND
jgi:transcription elongation factor Elf1